MQQVNSRTAVLNVSYFRSTGVWLAALAMLVPTAVRAQISFDEVLQAPQPGVAGGTLELKPTKPFELTEEQKRFLAKCNAARAAWTELVTKERFCPAPGVWPIDRLSVTDTRWRGDLRRELSEAENEYLARKVGYAGGGTATDPNYDIKADRPFRQALSDNGFRLLDAINDAKTGLQAVFLEYGEPKRAVMLFRGTEPFRETMKDIGTDLDINGIGWSQYQANKERIAQWVKSFPGELAVVGHSLGGALAQRVVVDHGPRIARASLFNSPGIDRKTAAKVTMANLLDARGQPKIRYYVHPDDWVSQAGGAEHLFGCLNRCVNDRFTGPMDRHSFVMLFDGHSELEQNLDFFAWQASRPLDGSERAICEPLIAYLERRGWRYVDEPPAAMELSAEEKLGLLIAASGHYAGTITGEISGQAEAEVAPDHRMAGRVRFQLEVCRPTETKELQRCYLGLSFGDFDPTTGKLSGRVPITTRDLFRGAQVQESKGGFASFTGQRQGDRLVGSVRLETDVQLAGEWTLTKR